MIAVDGRRDGDGGDTRGDELDECHLGGGVLEGDALRAEFEESLATHGGERVWVIEVAVEDFLGESEGPVEAVAHGGEAVIDGGVGRLKGAVGLER